MIQNTENLFKRSAIKLSRNVILIVKKVLKFKGMVYVFLKIW